MLMPASREAKPAKAGVKSSRKIKFSGGETLRFLLTTYPDKVRDNEEAESFQDCDLMYIKEVSKGKI